MVFRGWNRAHRPRFIHSAPKGGAAETAAIGCSASACGAAFLPSILCHDFVIFRLLSMLDPMRTAKQGYIHSYCKSWVVRFGNWGFTCKLRTHLLKSLKSVSENAAGPRKRKCQLRAGVSRVRADEV